MPRDSREISVIRETTEGTVEFRVVPNNMLQQGYACTHHHSSRRERDPNDGLFPHPLRVGVFMASFALSFMVILPITGSSASEYLDTCSDAYHLLLNRLSGADGNDNADPTPSTSPTAKDN